LGDSGVGDALIGRWASAAIRRSRDSRTSSRLPNRRPGRQRLSSKALVHRGAGSLLLMHRRSSAAMWAARGQHTHQALAAREHRRRRRRNSADGDASPNPARC